MTRHGWQLVRAHTGRVRAADEFEQVFRARYARLCREVAAQVHDPDLAERVVQESFAELRRDWGAVTAYERPDAWVETAIALRTSRLDPLEPAEPEDEDLEAGWFDVDAALDSVLAKHRARVRRALVSGAAVVVVALALAISAIVREGTKQPPVAYDEVVGTYASDLSRADGVAPEMVGSWTITLNPAGGLTVTPPAGYVGTVEGHGYTVREGTLETTVFAERPDCRRTQGLIGFYRVQRDHEDLRFELVRDSCAARRALFAGVWSRTPAH